MRNVRPYNQNFMAALFEAYYGNTVLQLRMKIFQPMKRWYHEISFMRSSQALKQERS